MAWPGLHICPPQPQASNTEKMTSDVMKNPTRLPQVSSQTFLKFLPYGLAVMGLVWVLHDVNPDRIFHQATRVNWWWVGLAVGCDTISYVSQGWRWHSLLPRPTRVTVGQTIQAVYAGLFASEVLPLRAGEVVRAVLVGKWANLPVTTIVPSIIVERLLDGLWLVVALSMAATWLPVPKQVVEATWILAGAMIVASGLGCLVVWQAGEISKNRLESLSPPLAGIWLKLYQTGWLPLVEGVQSLTPGRHLALAGVLSGVYLSTQVVAFWGALRACQIQVALPTALLVFLLVQLGTMLPNTPSNIGTYQFFCTLGLTLVGIEKNAAVAASMLVFLILTVPLWILGCIATSQCRLSGAQLNQIVAQQATEAPDAI